MTLSEPAHQSNKFVPPVQIRPLSWDEARRRLRAVLENYVNDPPPPRRRHDLKEEDPVKQSSTSSQSLLSWCIRKDLDLYSGALALSVALLVVTCTSFFLKKNQASSNWFPPGARMSIYRTQVAAAVLLTVGSLLSCWMVRRRRFLSLNDADNSKRREVSRFLRALERLEEPGTRAAPSSSSIRRPDQSVELTGTSLTGLYPVYRCDDKSVGSWTRLPSLLLVEGDLVALQIGDLAPAHCVLLGTSRGHEIMAGERLTLQSYSETPEQAMAGLPRGKTTIPADSDHLLTLCNHMRTFLVVDTPLAEFIRRPSATSKESQISRQVRVIRESLFLLAIILLVVTSAIVFSRLAAVSERISLVITIPLLAALGVLPIIGPAFLFFLEVLGTARILLTVHPYASLTGPIDDSRGGFPRTHLLLRYMGAVALSRLSLWKLANRLRSLWQRLVPGSLAYYSAPSHRPPELVRVPPASLNLLEKLGVATAFTLVDDELACEPHAIPQQLLIPSGKGLKLLDLCPAYEEENADVESKSDSLTTARKRGRSFDSDSESDETSQAQEPHGSFRRKILSRRRLRRRVKVENDGDGTGSTTEISSFDVQFEDPTWWQHLPSLKSIGLCCLLLDEARHPHAAPLQWISEASHGDDGHGYRLAAARSALVRLVCNERCSKQLQALAQCIGFSTQENASGPKGDISPFAERLRLHILSDVLVKNRLLLDSHERSSEQSRWWGLLRPDATSLIVQDSRTRAHQLCTVGDPAVVMDLCHEAWQGEISTILPLSAIDRRTITETANNWKLGDLDVSAFSYSPVPLSLESHLAATEAAPQQAYLLDHTSCGEPSQVLAKDKHTSVEWTFLKNQIFLGMLGSLVVPRREIQNLLKVLKEAGVRFVYFSPRNMRRQKELASQMGIDVAWNCAISLRPLESGAEDPHRMVSNYADWDVNAKLPHGVDDVRLHLEEVDNVPLLVSLFTDATKATTKEMLDIFQQYSDTVIAVGLSHLSINEPIFSAADIAVGIDILADPMACFPSGSSYGEGSSHGELLPAELEFVSSISAHSCAFRFRGASSVAHVAAIIEQGRAALDAALAAAAFVLFGCVSFSLLMLSTACLPSTIIPYVPALGAVLFLEIILPILGFTVAMSEGDHGTMKLVPPKNDAAITFRKKEGYLFYSILIFKAIPPAVLPQLLHMIAFGELLLSREPGVIESSCPDATTWVDVVRCKGISDYFGEASISAGNLYLGQFVLCVIVASTGFVRRFDSVTEEPPWSLNQVWFGCIFLASGLTIIYLAVVVEGGSSLPWYYFFIAAITPFLCLLWVEICKRSESKLEKRSEKLRRLQFETRLGAWSPK